MSKSLSSPNSRARRSARQPKRRSRPWLIWGLAAVVIVAAAGFLLLGQGRSGEPPADTTAARTKGNAAAPIVIEEWGDFL